MSADIDAAIALYPDPSSPPLFAPQNIVVGLGADNWRSTIDFCLPKGVTTFHVDEPITKDWANSNDVLKQVVRDATAYLANRGNLIISDWDTEFAKSWPGTGPICGYHIFCAHASLRGLAMEQNPQSHLGANESFDYNGYATDDPRYGWTWLQEN